jgi:nucleoside-diphosphate-sugar epimerase
MVIGNGFVANRFSSYNAEDEFLIFASGVSNSKNILPDLFLREKKLLTDCIRKYNDRIFVYFSTCSVYDPGEKKSAYVQHKLTMEEIIKTGASRYILFRVSNLAGRSTNPNTVLNFFFYHIQNGINFDLWTKACRNIIDIDDAFSLTNHILKNGLFLNKVVNIANSESYPVKAIVASIENFLGKKSNYIEIKKGGCYLPDLSLIKPLPEKLGIDFSRNYLGTLLRKYYSP